MRDNGLRRVRIPCVTSRGVREARKVAGPREAVRVTICTCVCRYIDRTVAGCLRACEETITITCCSLGCGVAGAHGEPTTTTRWLPETAAKKGEKKKLRKTRRVSCGVFAYQTKEKGCWSDYKLALAKYERHYKQWLDCDEDFIENIKTQGNYYDIVNSRERVISIGRLANSHTFDNNHLESYRKINRARDSRELITSPAEPTQCHVVNEREAFFRHEIRLCPNPQRRYHQARRREWTRERTLGGWRGKWNINVDRVSTNKSFFSLSVEHYFYHRCRYRMQQVVTLERRLTEKRTSLLKSLVSAVPEWRVKKFAI